MPVEFLQFNGQDTNGQAGSVAGYNSLPGLPPLNRSELYELWWRQRFFDDKLIVRIGKVVPTYDFNNVVRPLALGDDSLAIPAVSSLIYTPIFINPTLLGTMPGYYNSAYGVTATVAPTNNFYVSAGAYDGNGARGEQTGLDATPRVQWLLLHRRGGGLLAVPRAGQDAGHRRRGRVVADGRVVRRRRHRGRGARDLHLRESAALGAQPRRRQQRPHELLPVRHQRILDTRPVNKYVGVGLTGFGLVPRRPRDSFGGGVAVSWLNENLGFRNNEVMLAAYYQMHLVGDIYFQPTVTYIPNPGSEPDVVSRHRHQHANHHLVLTQESWLVP